MIEKVDNNLTIEKGVEIKISPSLEHVTLRDHFVNGAKAILSAIPGAGSSLASLMGDYIPKQKEKRLLQFIKELAIKLEEYDSTINKEYIKSEEFEYLFEECLRGVLANYQEYKLFCYKGILINSLRLDIRNEQKEYYLHLVNNLTELHLKILAILNNPKGYFELYSLSADSVKDMGFQQVFETAMPGIDLEIIKAAFEELFQLGLVNTGKSIFGVNTAGRGFDIVSGRMSNLGKSMIKFCTEY